MAVGWLAMSACHTPSPSNTNWPAALPLSALERRTAGCYRVRGIARADSADTGFAADSILRLDSTVTDVLGPPQGPDVRELVNEHSFAPRPDNFDTIWWRGHDGALHLEWRTPRRSTAVAAYAGGAIEAREVGGSLVGATIAYRDAGPFITHTVTLERLVQCPATIE